MRPRRVVTLPPGVNGDAALTFAQEARRQGAELLEVRTDLHGGDSGLDLGVLARVLPLLAAVRGKESALPPSWRDQATVIDVERGGDGAPVAGLLSHHAPTPLAPSDAVAEWASAGVREDQAIKHVEPLGSVGDASRLVETQRRLEDLFEVGRVTVLATGAEALPFRCVLAERNALDYVALSDSWCAAEGQRLLADAVRADAPAGISRLGILGARIAHSRSPRVHAQPFDRLDLPEGLDLAALLHALHPHYRGFAVTAPFKRAAAQAAKSELAAVNTLVRSEGGWRAYNTDVDGAEAVLKALSAPEVTVLGGGGATVALTAAAARTSQRVEILRRAEVTTAPVRGVCVWTWPESIAPPSELHFDRARVALIAYGPPARRIAREVRSRGGDPLLLGPRWFIAQARRQRDLWRTAT